MLLFMPILHIFDVNIDFNNINECYLVYGVSIKGIQSIIDTEVYDYFMKYKDQVILKIIIVLIIKSLSG